MTVYVAEIQGRPILAFFAETAMEAEALVGEEWLQADLRCLQTAGRPLWDGTSEIHVREAAEDERGAWDSSRARAVLSKETDADDMDWLAYLVPVSDPTDIDDDC